MLKTAFRYDSKSCAFVPVVNTTKQVAKRLLGYFSISFMLGLIALVIYDFRFPSYDETILLKQNKILRTEWKVLHDRIGSISSSLKFLENEDDNHYRVVLNMEKLGSEIRNGGTGGHELEVIENIPQINDAYQNLESIRKRIQLETQSLNEIENRIRFTEGMLASRPAMQPIDNRQLTRFNTIFGMRLHPVYGDWRFHHGLDLTANLGTPVYATGDGFVTHAKYGGGYGNVIFINHGYGFETRYAHLSGYKVVEGQKVTRGELIGYVGNTGVSTNPHLHYEVLYNNKWINPIHFMYRDLPQSEYNDIINSAKR